MAEIRIKLSSELKSVLFSKIKEEGFESISEWAQMCAEKTISETNTINDPDIREKFLLMMCIHYGPVSVRISPERMYTYVLDIIDTFYNDYHITLLPIEVKKLIDIYYSCRDINPKLRQMYADYYHAEYQNHCAEYQITDCLPKETDPKN